ncbi:unnamed protein product [Prorocentrum cordatum]|uniref:HEAT repeat-containing protein 1 n=1 Tax=Prorocentrum cordatum TaxID=2364126 RepID=A0ABN9THV9_9DINO|nr:unnamed protein product [Polarella glacialis]
MDPRFDTSRDPRFRRAPRHVRRVEVDKRFAHMFEDKRFVETPTVDARGRRLRRDTGRLKLKEFYQLADGDAAGGAAVGLGAATPPEPSRAAAPPARRTRAAKAGAKRRAAAAEDEDEAEEEADAARAAEEEQEAPGSSACGEEDSEEDEDEGEESEEEEEEAEGPGSEVWAARQCDEESAPRGDATRRLAIMGCDWDKTNASDLLVMLRTYLGGGESRKTGGALRSGAVERVAVYPSDWGLEQMAKEAQLGPQGLGSSSSKPGRPTTDEEDERQQTEALRRYQLQRTMYHWALAECDSAATAGWLYDQLDGLEAEGLSTRPLDLRFVPEDLTPPHAPTSEATEMPKRYKPPEQTQSALGHSKVRCTWDEGPAQRKKDLMRKKFSAKDMADMDLQTYLAASSDEGGDDEGAETLRKLVADAGSGSEAADAAGGESDSDSSSREEQMGDMEATFSVKAAQLEEELVERVKSQGDKAHTLEAKEKSTWEKYLDKRKEKRRETRRKAKEERSASKLGETEAAQEARRAAPAGKGSAASEEADQGDLELLAMDETSSKGFNLRMPQRRAHRGSAKQDGADGGFKVDVDDPRIAKIFSSADFEIDPTKPEFRNSEGMREVLKKKRQRRPKRQAQAADVQHPAPAAAPAAAVAPQAPAAAGAPAKAGSGGLQLFASKASTPCPPDAAAAAAEGTVKRWDCSGAPVESHHVEVELLGPERALYVLQRSRLACLGAGGAGAPPPPLDLRHAARPGRRGAERRAAERRLLHLCSHFDPDGEEPAGAAEALEGQLDRLRAELAEASAQASDCDASRADLLERRGAHDALRVALPASAQEAEGLAPADGAGCALEGGASQHDSDAFASLARNGVAGVSGLDPDLAAFSTLFEGAQRDRELLSTEENAHLDSEIRRMLILLSPHMQTRAAQECLEGLLQRYQVHRWNVDDVLASTLPYHDSPLFSRLLQGLHVEGKPRWSWLQTLKQNRATLVRAALAKYCAKDLSVLSFIGEVVQETLRLHKVNRALTTFFVSVWLATLASVTTVNNTLVDAALPAVMAMLRKPHLRDSFHAGLAVAGALCVKAELSPEVRTYLMERAMRLGSAGEPQKPAVALLALMLQAQVVDDIPQKVLGALAQLGPSGFASVLPPGMDCGNLLGGVVEACLLRAAALPAEDPQGAQLEAFCGGLLANPALVDRYAPALCAAALQAFAKARARGAGDAAACARAEALLQRPVASLGERQPVALSAAFRRGVGAALERGADPEPLVRLLSPVVPAVDSPGDGLVPVVQGFEHTSARVRCQAVQAAAAGLEGSSGDAPRDRLLASLLLDAVQDRSAEVVQAALGLKGFWSSSPLAAAAKTVPALLARLCKLMAVGPVKGTSVQEMFANMFPAEAKVTILTPHLIRAVARVYVRTDCSPDIRQGADAIMLPIVILCLACKDQGDAAQSLLPAALGYAKASGHALLGALRDAAAAKAGSLLEAAARAAGPAALEDLCCLVEARLPPLPDGPVAAPLAEAAGPAPAGGAAAQGAAAAALAAALPGALEGLAPEKAERALARGAAACRQLAAHQRLASEGEQCSEPLRGLVRALLAGAAALPRPKRTGGVSRGGGASVVALAGAEWAGTAGTSWWRTPLAAALRDAGVLRPSEAVLNQAAWATAGPELDAAGAAGGTMSALLKHMVAHKGEVLQDSSAVCLALSKYLSKKGGAGKQERHGACAFWGVGLAMLAHTGHGERSLLEAVPAAGLLAGLGGALQKCAEEVAKAPQSAEVPEILFVASSAVQRLAPQGESRKKSSAAAGEAAARTLTQVMLPVLSAAADSLEGSGGAVSLRVAELCGAMCQSLAAVSAAGIEPEAAATGMAVVFRLCAAASSAQGPAAEQEAAAATSSTPQVAASSRAALAEADIGAGFLHQICAGSAAFKGKQLVGRRGRAAAELLSRQVVTLGSPGPDARELLEDLARLTREAAGLQAKLTARAVADEGGDTLSSMLSALAALSENLCGKEGSLAIDGAAVVEVACGAVSDVCKTLGAALTPRMLSTIIRTCGALSLLAPLAPGAQEPSAPLRACATALAAFAGPLGADSLAVLRASLRRLWVPETDGAGTLDGPAQSGLRLLLCAAFSGRPGLTAETDRPLLLSLSQAAGLGASLDCALLLLIARRAHAPAHTAGTAKKRAGSRKRRAAAAEELAVEEAILGGEVQLGGADAAADEALEMLMSVGARARYQCVGTLAQTLCALVAEAAGQAGPKGALAWGQGLLPAELLRAAGAEQAPWTLEVGLSVLVRFVSRHGLPDSMDAEAPVDVSAMRVTAFREDAEAESASAAAALSYVAWCACTMEVLLGAAEGGALAACRPHARELLALLLRSLAVNHPLTFFRAVCLTLQVPGFSPPVAKGDVLADSEVTLATSSLIMTAAGSALKDRKELRSRVGAERADDDDDEVDEEFQAAHNSLCVAAAQHVAGRFLGAGGVKVRKGVRADLERVAWQFLDSLCRLSGKRAGQPVVEMCLPTAAEHLAAFAAGGAVGEPEEQVAVAVCAYVGTAVEQVGRGILPNIGAVVPALLDVVGRLLTSRGEGAEGDAAATEQGAMGALRALVLSVGPFLSPFLPRLLGLFAELRAAPSRAPLLDGLGRELVASVPYRLLMPALSAAAAAAADGARAAGAAAGGALAAAQRVAVLLCWLCGASPPDVLAPDADAASETLLRLLGAGPATARAALGAVAEPSAAAEACRGRMLRRSVAARGGGGGIADKMFPGYKDKIWAALPKGVQEFKVKSENDGFEKAIAQHKSWQATLLQYKAKEQGLAPSAKYRKPAVDWRRQMERGTMHYGRWYEGPGGSDYRPGNTVDRLENVKAPFTDAEWEERKQHRSFDISGVGLIWRICKRISWTAGGQRWDDFVDMDPFQAPAARPAAAESGAAPAAAPATRDKVVKLSAVLDQGDDGEVRVADASTHAQWHANYQQQVLAAPAEDAEPSVEQLTALDHRVNGRGCSPYADFALWGPFARKGVRAAKFRAWYPTGDGTFTAKELPGPGNLQHWEAAWKVFATACIMLMAVARSALEHYAEKIRKLVHLWPECWHLIATADDQMRAEHMVRLKRRYEAKLAAGETPAPDWNSAAPWSTVYRLAADDEAFWDAHVRHPAAAWVARGGRGVLLAPEEAVALAHLPGGLAAITPPTEQRPPATGKRRKTGPQQQQQQRPQQASGNGGPPSTAHGSSAGGPRKQTNDSQKAQGPEVCKNWNQGNPANECGKLGAPSTCPKGRLHKCAKCGDASHKAPDSALIRVGQWGNALVRRPTSAGAAAGQPAAQPALAEVARPAPTAAAPASRQERREQENHLCVGGLRSTAASVARLPRLCALGKEVAALYDDWVSEYPEAAAVVQRFGDKSYTGPGSDLVEVWRSRLREHLGAPPEGQTAHEWGRPSPLQAELLHAWLQAGGDPEICLRDWCQVGAPLGVEVPIPTCGIFPAVPAADGAGTAGRLDLALAQGVFNYQSISDDPEGSAAEVHRYLEQDFAVSLPGPVAQQRFPGGSISRMALITKKKPDGGVERRIIVDLKRSRPTPVNSRARVPERPVLPRMRDLIRDTLALVHGAAPPGSADPAVDLEFAIADFSDAYMHLRTHPDELRHCLSPDVVPGRLLLWITLCFGLSGAPLIWCRVAAALARLVQSCVDHRQARMQLYLDDPMWALWGTKAQRDRQLGLALWVLIGMGVRIAWHKAVRGSAVVWIGASIVADVAAREITVSIPASMVAELLASLELLASGAMVSLRELKRCTGKHSWVAGLLPRIRWAVSIMYAVAASAEGDIRSGAEERRRLRREDPRPKHGLVAAKRIALPVRWLTALWCDMQGPVTRRISWARSPPATVVIVDASPWGLGLVLAHLASGRVLEYAHSDVLDDDERLLLVHRGSSSSQQALEALALLVALKLWGRFMRASSTTVDLRGDNSAALALAGKLSSSSPVMNFIGAELALELESLDVRDVQPTHIPGHWNVAADWVSRRSAPRSAATVPAELVGAKAHGAPGSDTASEPNGTPSAMLTSLFELSARRTLALIKGPPKRPRYASRSGTPPAPIPARWSNVRAGVPATSVVTHAPVIPCLAPGASASGSLPRFVPLAQPRGRSPHCILSQGAGQLVQHPSQEGNVDIGASGVDLQKRDFPRPPLPDAGHTRGSINAALSIAGDPVRLASALGALRQDFYANSSREAVSRKRADVCRLAEQAASSIPDVSAPFPLEVAVVHAVAAALKGARFKSAEQYLNELRLEHIERGAPASQQLARAFDQCKRSVRRGIGPKSKAAELREDGLRPTDVLESLQGISGHDLASPWRAWVVATRFLLREIELAAARLAHVDFPSAGSVRMRLPVSKTDTWGAGAAVTLKCTCLLGPFDKVSCPVHILVEHLEARRRVTGTRAQDARELEEPFFPDVAGGTVSKAAVIQGWQRLAVDGHPVLGGHSARRSGAKRYARSLWPLSSIQTVGRWASCTVLEYVEEALTDLPLDGQGRTASSSSEPPPEAQLEPLARRVANLEASMQSHAEARGRPTSRLPEVKISAPPAGWSRWVRSESSGTIHAVASPPDTPLPSWRTCCGWRFGSPASLSTFLSEAPAPDGANLCRKCPSPYQFALSLAAASPGGGDCVA